MPDRDDNPEVYTAGNEPCLGRASSDKTESQTSCFISAFAEFLKTQTAMTRGECQAARKMLDDRFYTLNFRQSGPCVRCAKPIKYGPLAPQHKAKTDEWVDSLGRIFQSGKTFIRLSGNTSFTIYKLKPENVLPYLCAECVAFVHSEVKRVQREQRELLQQFLAGLEADFKNPSARPDQRFQCFCLWMKESGEASRFESNLRNMPYSDFLASPYWDVVRSYVKHHARYMCKLCKAPNPDVHHRSYEFRGCEYRRLDDLVALCRTCHSKYHGKLPPEPENRAIS